MFFKTQSGRSIYYETKIGHNKNHLVLLNGLTQSTVAWSLMEPYLKDYNLLLLDFVFQGKSEKNGSWQSFDQHAKDVWDLLNYLNIKRPHIAGLSYGSLVAQHYAVLFPNSINTLILMSSFCTKTPYYLAIESAWEKALQVGGYGLLLEVMLPSVLSENYFNSPIIPIDLMKEARSEINNDPGAILKLMKATKERSDYSDKLQEIKSPTLIIHGERDLLFPIHMGEVVHYNIKNSEFVVLRHVGHTLNLEAAMATSTEINRFLKKQE